MKKRNKLEIKKVTLRNLDVPILDTMAGGFVQPTVNQNTCYETCVHTCIPSCIPTGNCYGCKP
jgi:hypothetical protein